MRGGDSESSSLVFGGGSVRWHRDPEMPEAMSEADGSCVMPCSLLDRRGAGTDGLRIAAGHRNRDLVRCRNQRRSDDAEQGRRIFDALAAAVRSPCHTNGSSGARTMECAPTDSASHGWSTTNPLPDPAPEHRVCAHEPVPGHQGLTQRVRVDPGRGADQRSWTSARGCTAFR